MSLSHRLLDMLEADSDMDMVVGLINSTIDKIYVSAARNKVEISQPIASMKGSVRASMISTSRCDFVHSIMFALNQLESYDKFKTELYETLVALIATLRRMKNVVPNLDIKKIIETLSSICVKE